MSFSDLTFIFYILPVAVALHALAPKRVRNAVLFVLSMAIYAYGGGIACAALLLGVIALHFAAALALEQAQGKARKALLCLALCADFALLLFFKYRSVLFSAPRRAFSAALPLGISFYLFQSSAYLIDVYRGEAAAQRFFDYGAFISAFPQLTMGPILRYREWRDALRERTVHRTDLEQGFELFVVGLGYKVLLADPLASLWAALTRIGFSYISTPLAWLGAVGYSLQLYFDFAGYSLMAMGLGQMLALPVPRNFDTPYVSRSVSEFYRRWHITLGTWFRDYVYIPLGGSRRGAGRTVLALTVVWVLTGLWHGSSLNFLLWGLSLLVLILLEKFLLRPVLERRSMLSHIYLLFVIVQTWVVFRITDLRQLGAYFGRLYPFFGHGSASNSADFARYFGEYWWLLALGVLFATPYPRRFFEKYRSTPLVWVPLFAVFWASVYLLAAGAGSAFLYFSF